VDELMEDDTEEDGIGKESIGQLPINDEKAHPAMYPPMK
jgi:hypothetical protein